MSLRLEENVKEGLRIARSSKKKSVNTLFSNGHDCDTAFLYDLEDRIIPCDSDWLK